MPPSSLFQILLDRKCLSLKGLFFGLDSEFYPSSVNGLKLPWSVETSQNSALLSESLEPDLIMPCVHVQYPWMQVHKSGLTSDFRRSLGIHIFFSNHQELFQSNHTLLVLLFWELFFLLFRTSVKWWYLCVSIAMCTLRNPVLQIVDSILTGLRGGALYCPVCWFDDVTVQIDYILSRRITRFIKSGYDAGIPGST